MRETTFYERLLGIERPWRVHDVRLALEQGDVEVGVQFVGETLVCPACGAACPGYDRRPRMWRHLDTMQYRTLVRAEVPRARRSIRSGGRSTGPCGNTAMTGWRDTLPVVDAPCEPDAAATPGVHAATHERVAGGPCVGDQGIGDAAVARPVAGLGGPHVEPLVRVGDSQSVGADQEGRADDQTPLGRGDQRRPDERHERARRGHQRQDPVDQAAGLRISQPRAVPQRHLPVHLGGLDLYPDALAAHTNS